MTLRQFWTGLTWVARFLPMDDDVDGTAVAVGFGFLLWGELFVSLELDGFLFKTFFEDVFLGDLSVFSTALFSALASALEIACMA